MIDRSKKVIQFLFIFFELIALSLLCHMAVIICIPIYILSGQNLLLLWFEVFDKKMMKLTKI